MAKIVVMEHPLIKHKIGLIRRKETGTKDFRQTISEIAMLICYEATRDLKLDDVEIETPICKTTCSSRSPSSSLIPAILRSVMASASSKVSSMVLLRSDSKVCWRSHGHSRRSVSMICKSRDVACKLFFPSICSSVFVLQSYYFRRNIPIFGKIFACIVGLTTSHRWKKNTIR